MSDRSRSSGFRPAWWLPGPHAQTLWGKLARRVPRVPLAVERWDTPDGDVLELHRLAAGPDVDSPPHVLVLHGLEGTVRSHYARGLLAEAQRRGWSADLLLWRSCGSEPNRTRRFYHSGETGDLALVVDRLLAETPGRRLGIAGVSLGGNVLLKYLGERGTDVPPEVVAAVAVSVPLDLAAGADRVGRGFSRVYQRYFISSLRHKALEKQRRFPDIGDPERIARVCTLREFDDLVTAPVHGFASAEDYYSRSSSIAFLAGIRVPTLLLNAMDDPFLTPGVLERTRIATAANPALTVELPAGGGHAGFVGGANPLRPEYYLERRVAEFLAGSFGK